MENKNDLFENRGREKWNFVITQI